MDRLMTGDIPENIEPHIFDMLIHDPVFMEVFRLMREQTPYTSDTDVMRAWGQTIDEYEAPEETETNGDFSINHGAEGFEMLSGTIVEGDFIMVAGGRNHSISLKDDGTVWACGSNNYGQLGDGTLTNRSSPVQVSGLTGITAIAAGYYHSIA